MASTIISPSHLETSTDSELPTLTQDEVCFEPGTYGCVRKNGEDWPVVVGDDEIIEKFFKEKSKAVGRFLGQKRYPAIHPGTLTLFWLVPTIFEPFHADTGKAIRASTMNPLLRDSWDEAFTCAFEGRTLAYWKERLVTQAKSRQDRLSKSRKRKGSPDLRYPPGYGNEEGDDDEGEDLFLPKNSNAGVKIEREFRDTFSSADIDALYEDNDSIGHAGAADSSKKTKLDADNRSSVTLSATPRPSRCSMRGPGSSFPGTKSERPSPAISTAWLVDPSVKADGHDDELDKVTVYVGNPHAKFIVTRNRLRASPLLWKQATHHTDNGWYLMSPFLSSLNPVAFAPICQYLERGAYDPKILQTDEGTQSVRLEREFTKQQRGKEIIRTGAIYFTAQILGLSGLQALALQKLKLLTEKATYEPSAILCVIELVFREGEDDLRQYLISCFADQYWDIMEKGNKKAVEIMRGNNELTRGILRAMIERTPSQMKTLNGANAIKQEKNVGIKLEGNQSASSVAANQLESHGETLPITIEYSPADTSQTEYEMIRMALRHSNPDAPEEELVRLLQNQSQYFQACGAADPVR